MNFRDTAKCMYKSQVKHVVVLLLTFFVKLFHFLRFEVIQYRIVVQILPFICFFWFILVHVAGIFFSLFFLIVVEVS